jgi:hypothetical protein
VAARAGWTIGHPEWFDAHAVDGCSVPEVDSGGQRGLFGKREIPDRSLDFNYGGGLAL